MVLVCTKIASGLKALILLILVGHIACATSSPSAFSASSQHIKTGKTISTQEPNKLMLSTPFTWKALWWGPSSTTIVSVFPSVSPAINPSFHSKIWSMTFQVVTLWISLFCQLMFLPLLFASPWSPTQLIVLKKLRFAIWSTTQPSLKYSRCSGPTTLQTPTVTVWVHQVAWSQPILSQISPLQMT